MKLSSFSSPIFQSAFLFIGFNIIVLYPLLYSSSFFYDIFSSLRPVSIAVYLFFASSIFIPKYFSRIDRSRLLFLVLLLFYFLYPLFLYFVHSNPINFDYQLFFISFLFCLQSGAILLLDTQKTFFAFNLLFDSLFQAMAYILFLFMIFSRSVSLLPALSIQLFDPVSLSLMRYSHSMAIFFGLCFIFFLYKFLDSRLFNSTKISSSFFSLLSLTFLLLSGSRGEFIAAFVVALILCHFKLKLRGPIELKIFTCGILVLVFAALIYILFPELVLFDRLFSWFKPTTSEARFNLYPQAINLLFSSPIVLLFGSGLMAFQNYYGFDSGLSSHSLFSEIALSSGIFGLLTAGFLVYKGIRKAFYSHHSPMFIDFMFLFYLFVELKGANYTSLTALAPVFYFTARFLHNSNYSCSTQSQIQY